MERGRAVWLSATSKSFRVEEGGVQMDMSRFAADQKIEKGHTKTYLLFMGSSEAAVEHIIGSAMSHAANLSVCWYLSSSVLGFTRPILIYHC